MSRPDPVGSQMPEVMIPSGLDLRSLEYFVTVARLLHFGRAAEQLYIRQSTVSQGVRRLEDLIGAPLFDRSTRMVSLTELGRSFLPDAVAALAAVRGSFERARSLAEAGASTVQIGHTSDLVGRLGHVLAEAQRAAQGIRLAATPLVSPAQVRAVRDGSLDAGICWAPGVGEDVERVRVGGARFGVVVPAGHPWAARTGITMEEMATEPLIVWPRAASPGLYAHLERAMNATDVPWTVIGTGMGPDNVTVQVLSGFGVAVVLDHRDSYPGSAGVALIPITDRRAWVDRVLIWSRTTSSPWVPAVREAVVGAFAHELEARPAERV